MAEYLKIGDKEFEIEFANTSFQRNRGLMFRQAFPRDKALVIPLKKESEINASIHSFFVMFPFDVLFLDKRMRIVDMRQKVPPFMPFVKPSKPSKFIVELASGIIAETGAKVGDGVGLAFR